MYYSTFQINFFILPVIPSISSLPKWINIKKSIFPSTNCTSLVVWNRPYSIGSTLGLPKLTNFLRNSTFIPSYILSVLVGLLLSDAGLSIQKNSTNARLGFKQSMIHFDFFFATFLILAHFCSTLPYLDPTIVKNVLYNSIRMDTRAYPSLTILYHMFYINKVKIVPADIFNLLTPVALAYWIMGDGTGNSYKGLYLCTDSFTNYDVVRLMNVLLIRYNIKSSFVILGGQT